MAETFATGTAVTVMVVGALVTSLVAVICAVAGEKAMMKPVDETVATVGALVAHVMFRPGSGSPAASSASAVSCNDSPESSSALVGATATDATGTSCTETSAVPLMLPDVAVIVALPAPTAVTTP